jgi:FAD:protein FMN transferase
MFPLLAPCLLAVVAFAADGDRLLTLTGETMGTSYTVRAVTGKLPTNREHLQAAIDERLEQINDRMSNWRPDSELSRFNRHREDDWFPVSAETAEVVAAGLRIGRETNGAFDVTVGPLVRLWQFGPEPGRQPPTPEELAAARERVGLDLVEVRDNPPALRKRRPDVEVDLSGIAKGYGVDALARLLDERGFTNYLVEIGGEIRTRGRRPDGTAWRVGIEVPEHHRRAVQRIIELENRSLATSGDYRNYREVDGRRWSHTIDPRTGEPIGHTLASVSVIADTCMESDALATALMVLGPEDAYDWAVGHDLPVLLIVRETNGFVEHATPVYLREFPDAAATTGRLMTTYLLALVIFGVAVAAMAVGLLRRRPLRGTCGGLSNLRDKAGHPLCDACRSPAADCGGVEEGRQRSVGKEHPV